MPKTIFDTRFFLEHYYSQKYFVLEKTKEIIQKSKEKFISVIVLHEMYYLTLKKEGEETAFLRTTLLQKDFKVIKIDSLIAKNSAKFRLKYRLTLAESLIAATTQFLNGICYTDDSVFDKVTEIRTMWF